jgi:hypothetical protein
MLIFFNSFCLRWALEVKVDSVDPFKTGKTGSCINFAVKLRDATEVVHCIGFHDAEVISRRFKVNFSFELFYTMIC